MVLPEEEREYTGYEERARLMAEQGAQQNIQGVNDVLEWQPPTVPGTVNPDGTVTLQEQAQVQPAAQTAKGRITAGDMREASLNYDWPSMLERNDSERDEKRRQRLQRIANIEAIGNALAAVGGIASARRGGPVFGIDRTRADQALANMGQEEEEWANRQRQEELFKIQQTIAQMNQKKQAEDAAALAKERMEHEIEIDNRRAQQRKEEIGLTFDSNVKLQQMRGEQEMKQIGARGSVQERVEEKRSKRITEEQTQRANAQYDRVNPRAVTLMQVSPRGIQAVGELRKNERDLLYNMLVSDPEIKAVMEDDAKNNWTIKGAMSNPAGASEDVKNFIVQRYWTRKINEANELMRLQDVTLNELRIYEQDEGYDENNPLGLRRVTGGTDNASQ